MTDRWTYKPNTDRPTQIANNREAAVYEIIYNIEEKHSEEIDLKYLEYGLIPWSYWNKYLCPLKDLTPQERKLHKRKFRKVYRKAEKYNGLFFPKIQNSHVSSVIPEETKHRYSKTELRKAKAYARKYKRLVVFEFIVHQILEEFGYRYDPKSYRSYYRV